MSSECRGLDDDIGALAETLIGQPATLGSGVQGQSRTFLTTITHLGFSLAVGGLGTVEGYEDSGESTTVVAPSVNRWVLGLPTRCRSAWRSRRPRRRQNLV